LQRTNPQEAVWIAHLVRELLVRGTGQTLGIVAFSEAQQSEIERALERLGRDDAEFARRLYAEYNVLVLPGSYLAREEGGVNPGRNRVRIALVAPLAECMEAMQRVSQFMKNVS